MSEIEKITSRDNQRLVNARKVRDGHDKSRLFIEGRRLVDEALISKIAIDECFYVEDFRDTELLSTVAAKAPKIVEVSQRLLRSIADTDNSQGIILIAERPNNGAAAIEDALTARRPIVPIVLFLKEINSPSNLGAVLRTAEAAGIAGVVVSKNSADVYSSKSLRAAMGASFRVPIWDGAAFDEVLVWSKKLGLKSTAADIGAVISYTQIDWRVPRLVVFGSEAHGLTASELTTIDEHLKIPMESGVESLNLAVSAGVILFEARRQVAND